MLSRHRSCAASRRLSGDGGNPLPLLVNFSAVSSCKTACDAYPSHCKPSTLATCCRPHESVLQEQRARDPVHMPPEAQSITSVHALLSWDPGALPSDVILRGTTPLQARCIVSSSISHASCVQATACCHVDQRVCDQDIHAWRWLILHAALIHLGLHKTAKGAQHT